MWESALSEKWTLYHFHLEEPGIFSQSPEGPLSRGSRWVGRMMFIGRDSYWDKSIEETLSWSVQSE